MNKDLTPDQRIFLINRLAYCYYVKEEYQEANKLYYSALPIIPNPSSLTRRQSGIVLFYLGYYHKRYYRSDSALFYFFKAQETIEKIPTGKQDYKFTCLLKIGDEFYWKLHDYANAENYYKLTEVIEKSGTTANLMGISIEQMVGTMEAIAPKFAEARRAGTALDRVLLKMREQGIGVKDGVFDLNRGIDELKMRFAKGESATDLFGVEQAKMREILVMNQGDMNKYSRAVTDTSIAFEQAGKTTNNNAAALAQPKNKVNLMYIEIGEKLAPAVIHSTNAFNYLLKAVAPLDELIQAQSDRIKSLRAQKTELEDILQAESQADSIGTGTTVELESKLERYTTALKNVTRGSEDYVRIQNKIKQVESELAKERGASESTDKKFDREKVLADITKSHEEQLLLIKTQYVQGISDKETYSNCFNSIINSLPNPSDQNTSIHCLCQL